MRIRFQSSFKLSKGLIIFISPFFFWANAQERVSKASGIEPQVQQFMLEQKRIEAIELVKAVLEKNSAELNTAQAENQVRLRKMILRLGSTFLTEEGQRLHGLGVDAIEKSPDRSKSWFAESFEIEKYSNTTVAKDFARLHISQRQCSKALRVLLPVLDLVPYDSGLFVYKWQALECLEKADEAFTELGTESLLKKLTGSNVFLEIYKARSLIRNGQIEEGKVKLRELSRENPKFPEVSYWLWKLDPKEGQIDKSHLQNYVKLCQNLSLRYRTELFRDGFGCSRLHSAQAHLK